MIVCIAEKPSVARDIAAVLGATSTHNGYMEGNGYQVTWTFGHLCELKEPHEYSPLWKSWSLAQLPMIPQRFGIKLKNDEGIKKQFAVIEKLMSEAEGIVNCGDAGQEGELIQRWVMQKAGAKCPVRRLWISSLTEEAIREGFAHLKPQTDYQSLYEAGLCRAIGDWLLGMNATRLYTMKYGQSLQAPLPAPPRGSAKKTMTSSPLGGTGGGAVLSVGRVQTPTLALIVARQKEIENFKPEPYWVLTTVYRDTTFTAVLEEGARGFKTKEEGEAAMAAIKELPFTVTNVEQKKGTEAPPRLFDLTSLQVECNKKFGYSAEVTLGLIQSLYEKKYTTYPRVDTTFLTDDIYKKCPATLKGLEGYEALTDPLLQGGAASLPRSPEAVKLKKSKKVFDNSKVTDHHAIIPTGVPARGMTDMEKNVYNLVALRFIAVFYPDCKFVTTTVLGTTLPPTPPPRGGEEYPTFRATGKRITDPGWRVVFGKDDNTESPLPLGEGMGVGSTGPHEPNLAEKTTTPPKPYTEATLLRAMETAGRTVEDEELRDALKENGIGRPSTRAAIIETLFRRKYIERNRTTLRATAIGVNLIDTIRNELLKSAELTGQWERKLRQIERHEYSSQQFIDELKAMVTDLVTSVMREPQVVEGCVCPACHQGTILRGRTALGCSRWKEGCQFRAPLPT